MNLPNSMTGTVLHFFTNQKYAIILCLSCICYLLLLPGCTCWFLKFEMKHWSIFSILNRLSIVSSIDQYELWPDSERWADKKENVVNHIRCWLKHSKTGLQQEKVSWPEGGSWYCFWRKWSIWQASRVSWLWASCSGRRASRRKGRESGILANCEISAFGWVIEYSLESSYRIQSGI